MFELGMSYEDVVSFIDVDSGMKVAFGSYFGNTLNLLSVRLVDMDKIDFNINIRHLEIDPEYVVLIVANNTYHYLLKNCKD